jgi:glycerophosphoryl diester phosphodiesterase
VSSSFLVIGHRGAAGLAPEHTRPSFERALEIGVDMIELDVQITRDGHLVVFHDRELGRTVAASGPLRERTLAELRRLDTGSWFGDVFRGERLLTLPEVFDLLAGRAALNVEIKSPEPDWEATAQSLATALTAADALAGTIVSSFEMGALAAVRRRLPEVGIGVLWQSLDLAPAWDWARRLGAASLHPFVGLVTDELVGAARDRALRVHTWTVNDEEEMRRVAACSVDGIISDFPDRLRHVREQLAQPRA